MRLPRVIIDEEAGFCFGVVKAIAAAEEQLSHSTQLYCLGDIVHNDAEVKRLTSKGLCVIDHQQLYHIRDARVLIRAHGEPPSTYQVAHQQGIQLVDATCPIVLALQKRVKQGYEEMQKLQGAVVIYGKPGHAEVIGLTGQTAGTAVIVSDPDHIDHIDFSHPIRLYSQTTKSKEEYGRLVDNIRLRVEKANPDGIPGSFFVAYDTICNRVSNRAKQLEAFATAVDLVVFVSGPNSSNGHYLYDYCRSVQPNTIFISGPDDVDEKMIANLIANHNVASSSPAVFTIGITGATSTPRWLMEQVKGKLGTLPTA